MSIKEFIMSSFRRKNRKPDDDLSDIKHKELNEDVVFMRHVKLKEKTSTRSKKED